MSAARYVDRASRRNELIAAALQVFARKGVAGTAVSDIVKQASVAQGTFYLYFKSKDEVIDAVAEYITDRITESIERSLKQANVGAVGKVLALRDSFIALGDDPEILELAQMYHRPENRATHDRMADRLLLRLAPLVEDIVVQGVEEGVFVVEKPRAAAWLILGGLHVLELAYPNPADLSEAIVDVTNHALRALGVDGPLERKVGESSGGSHGGH